MRNPVIPTLLAAFAAPVAAQEPPQKAVKTEKSPFVVHEWGTFTSMQGSDGVGLEGLHWEEEALPKFVHSLNRFDEQRRSSPGPAMKLRRKVRAVTQKMETPVLYFHTDTPRRARIRVDFVGGLMTQWYPVAELMSPWPEHLGLKPGQTLDVSKIKRSVLQWHVDLIPLKSGLPQGIPAVAKHDPWHFAREVTAASVRTIPARKSKVGPQSERYLFYRGLGSFKLPIQAVAERGGHATFTNGEGQRIPFAVAMEVTKTGGRMEVLGAIEPNSKRRFSISKAPLTDLSRFVGDVHRSVIQALQREGLGTDEATAMVRTWSRQWFRSLGNRVIYFLPRRRVDQLLPLQITPRPDKIVRVLVGRLEYLTPETEDAVTRGLRSRFAADADERSKAISALDSLGRFLEPNVRNIVRRTEDATVKRNGERLLEELRKSGTEKPAGTRTSPRASRPGDPQTPRTPAR